MSKKEILKLKKENKILKEFVLDLLDDYPENFSYGPFEVEQAAIKHGIIVPTMVYEPCGENCNCREYVTTRELADGIECNRIAEFLGSKIDECPQCDPKVEGVCPDTTCEKFETEGSMKEQKTELCLCPRYFGDCDLSKAGECLSTEI